MRWRRIVPAQNDDDDFDDDDDDEEEEDESLTMIMRIVMMEFAKGFTATKL